MRLQLIEYKLAYVEEVQTAKHNVELRVQKLIEQYAFIRDWAKVFDSASNGEQKMILSRIIQKITVNREYEIHIYFYLTLEGFKQEVEQIENVTVIDVLAEDAVI